MSDEAKPDYQPTPEELQEVRDIGRQVQESMAAKLPDGWSFHGMVYHTGKGLLMTLGPKFIHVQYGLTVYVSEPTR